MPEEPSYPMGSAHTTVESPKRTVLSKSTTQQTIKINLSSIKSNDNESSGFDSVLSDIKTISNSRNQINYLNSNNIVHFHKCLSDSHESIYTSIDNSSELDSTPNEMDDNNSLLSFDAKIKDFGEFSAHLGDSNVNNYKRNYKNDDCDDGLKFSSMRSNKKTKSYENFVIIDKSPSVNLFLDSFNSTSSRKNSICYLDNAENIILSVMNIRKLKNLEKYYD